MNCFLFWTPYLQPDYYLLAVSYQFAVQYHFKTCIFFSHPALQNFMYTLLWFPMSCIPLALSFCHLGKESEHSHYQGSSAKTKPTWITACLFTSAFQQKCKHVYEYPISHFYPSFRVKIPLKIPLQIKTLQATLTRNTQDYSLPNTLWPELVVFISELLWFLPFYHMLKDGFLQHPESLWAL